MADQRQPIDLWEIARLQATDVGQEIARLLRAWRSPLTVNVDEVTDAILYALEDYAAGERDRMEGLSKLKDKINEQLKALGIEPGH